MAGPRQAGGSDRPPPRGRKPALGSALAGQPAAERPARKQFAGKPFAGKPFGEKAAGKRPDNKRPDNKRPEGKRFEGKRPEGRRAEGRRPEGKRTEGRRSESTHSAARLSAGDRSAAKPWAESKPEKRPGPIVLVEPQAAPPAERENDNLAQATTVQTVTVSGDENGLRVDRFLEHRFPGLAFSHIQRVIRKGELRVDGKRVDPKDRLEAGQSVRIPPLRLEAPKPAEGTPASEAAHTREFLKSITLYEDADVMVLNKPMGLAVQGGSGTVRHLDGMLDVLRDRSGQKPRLVHRIDKDTAGCLLVAKTRFAAAALAKSFRSREARKVYWALVAGVPKPRQGRISTYLAKEEVEHESLMRVAKHGEEGASHAVTYYAVVETAARQLAWLSLKPVTGRTHQLRAHCAHINHPIVGDPKYFSRENWELPGGIQQKLHLLARRIAVPHPRKGVIDVTAPLPAHMQQSWNLLGFDATRYDPIEEAPEG